MQSTFMKGHYILLAVLLFFPGNVFAYAFSEEQKVPLSDYIFTLINNTRRDNDIAPLIRDAGIDTVALGHANDTAEQFDATSLETREATYLGHKSSNGQGLKERFSASDVPTGWGFAENVGYWTRVPYGELMESSLFGLELMHDGMMAEVPPNDAHLRNILGDFTHIGIGLALGKEPSSRENSLFLVTNFSRYSEEEEERLRREQLAQVSASNRSLQDFIKPAHGGPFMDVRPEHRYATAILSMKNEKIIQGYNDGTFQPEQTVTRAELLKMLMDTVSLSPIGMEFNACFSDVFNQWFAPYVCVAKRRGWVQGYSDNTFRPWKTVSRAEAITLTYRSMEETLEQSGEPQLFDDVPPDSWFALPLRILAGNDLIPFIGIRFYPERSMARGEVAEMLFRAMQRLPEEVEETEQKGVLRKLNP